MSLVGWKVSSTESAGNPKRFTLWYLVFEPFTYLNTLPSASSPSKFVLSNPVNFLGVVLVLAKSVPVAVANILLPTG